MTTEDVVRGLLDSRYWRGNKYKGPAPYRPGSDSTGCSITIHGPEHGAWNDWVSKEGGSIYEFLDKCGLPRPDTSGGAKVAGTKRKYSSLADYAEQHYAPESAFLKAGWKEVTHHNRPALEWETETGRRWRFLDGDPAKPRFISEDGYKSCMYGLRRAVKIAREVGMPLVLCNGEPSVVVAQHYGVPACAKTSGESDLNQISLDAIIAEYPSGDIILAYDCDPTGQQAVQKVARQLVDAGYGVSIADLKLQAHADLADFCGLWTDEANKELRARARPYTLDPEAQQQVLSANLARAADMLNKTLKSARADEQAQDLGKQIEHMRGVLERISTKAAVSRVVSGANVDDHRPVFIPTGFKELDLDIGGLPVGDITVILAATGMGKTTLSASIIANILDEGLGLIVSTESPPGVYKSKIISAMAQRRYDSPSKDDQERIARHRGAFNAVAWDFLDDPSPSVVSIRAALAQKSYRVLVIDSVSRLVNAGDFAQVNGVMNAIQEMALDYKVAVLCTSQVGRDLSARAPLQKMPRLNDGYGGGPIENNAGIVLGLYRHEYYLQQELEKDRCDKYPEGTAALFIRKNRYGAGAGLPHTLQFTGGVGFFNLQRTHYDLSSGEREGVERPPQQRTILIDETVSTKRR